MKKRLLAMLLAVVMVAAMIPASVFAEAQAENNQWTYKTEDYKNYGRAIKATNKAEKEVQYLYAVVSEDLEYDGKAFEFDGTKAPEGKYVQLKVDTYALEKREEVFETSKTLVIDKGWDWQNFTTTFAEFKGTGWNNIVKFFRDNKHQKVETVKDVATYTARFTINDVHIEGDDEGKTVFTITPKSIADDEAILKTVEKTNFYFTGAEFDPEDLFVEMGIILQDSRIVVEDESLYTLVKGEDKDYTLTLVGAETEEEGVYEEFKYTREYLQNDPAFVIITGIGNYCDTWEIPVVFESPIVSFESNGGSVVDAQKVDYGTCAVKPEDPTKEGYKFAGWYTDEELTEAYDFETLVVEDTQLYAKWVANVNTGVTSNSSMTMIIAGGMILLAVALAVVVLKRRASQK